MSSDNINAYLTLHQLVLSVINAKAEKDLTNYEHYLQIAIEGLSEEIFPYRAPSVEVAYLTLSSAKMAILPADYIYYTKIAAKVGDRYVTLTLNKNMPPNRTYSQSDLCETTVANVSETSNEDLSTFGIIPFVPHYYNGNYVDTLYGLGGGTNFAYYKINERDRTITIQGVVQANEIILEYVSTGVKANGATIIDRFVVPALRAYVLWRIIDNDVRVPMNEKLRKERLYIEEMDLLSHKQNTFTATELLDALYSTYAQTAKR
jgi:hypothetical protein